MARDPVNPWPFLSSLVGKRVVVKLKWGQRYRGILVSTNQRMDLQLTKWEELVGDKARNGPDEMFIRHNNVLWISKDS